MPFKQRNNYFEEKCNLLDFNWLKKGWQGGINGHPGGENLSPD